MAEAAAPEAAGPATRTTVESTVDLRIVSPSWEAVNIPVLAELPASTSIGQLKERVRSEVTARGRSWQGMRLIYRGRVLDANDQTLGAVFGPNMGSGALAVHLVLRDANDSRPAQLPLSTASSPAPGTSSPALTTAPTSATTPAATPPLMAATPPVDPQQIHQRHPLQAQAATNVHWAQHWAAVNHMQQNLPAASTNRVYFSSTVLPQPTTDSQTTPPTADADGSSDEEMELLYPRGQAAAQAQTQQTQSVQPAQAAQTQTRHRGDVYILSSPQGPQALLLHGQSAMAYYALGTPLSIVNHENLENMSTAELRRWVVQQNQQIHQLERERMLTRRSTTAAELTRRILEQARTREQLRTHLNQLRQQQQQRDDQMWQRNLQRLQWQEQQLQLLRQHNQLIQQQQQANQEQAQRLWPQPRAANMLRRGGHLRVNNPGAGMVAAMVPHIWLIVRLLLFVWWFTSPNASWTRWTMVLLLATLMFVANTGMLDGLANQLWAPVRHHLDGLLPAEVVPAGGEVRAGGAGGNADPDPNPDPAQMAARLVGERRQANATWLMDAVRRAERLGIMFLASLAPGVAERHVALAEQRQAEAARQREEQEAAARATDEVQAALAARAAAEEQQAEPTEQGEAVPAAVAAQE